MLHSVGRVYIFSGVLYIECGEIVVCYIHSVEGCCMLHT